MQMYCHISVKHVKKGIRCFLIEEGISIFMLNALTSVLHENNSSLCGLLETTSIHLQQNRFEYPAYKKLFNAINSKL